MTRTFTKIIFILGVLTLFSLHVNAQSTLGATVNVDTSPRTPGPGDSVVITVTSYSTDLNQADFTWAVNGTTVKTGTGASTYTVTAPSLGSTKVIDITIQTKDLGEVSKRVTLSPAAVDIIEQPDSYIPPFYKGKALASVEGDIKLVAIPNLITSSGRKLTASEVVFTWSRNGEVLGDQSGIGKNMIVVKGPYITSQTINISVTASSPENALTAKGNDVLAVRKPQILFYENNPLLGFGLYKALPNPYTLNNSELSIFAVPYFFNSNVLHDLRTAFSWQINNTPVAATEAARNILTVRAPKGQGNSIVTLNVQNTNTIFQTTQNSLNINFGDTNNESVQF